MITLAVTGLLATLSSIYAARSLTQHDPPRAWRGETPDFRTWYLVTVALLVVVAALRWRVGTDYGSYETLYPVYRETPIGELTVINEPGLRIVAQLVSLVRDDPQSMFAAAAVVTNGLILRTLFKASPWIPLSVALFIVTGVWQASFNGIRQMIAVAILFSAHYAIINRLPARWFGAVALASLFHVSSAPFALLYWIPRNRLGLGRSALFICIAIGALMSYETLGAALAEANNEAFVNSGYFAEAINPLRVAVALAPIMLHLAIRTADRTPAADFYINLLILHAGVLIASLQSAYLARFSLFTGVYLCLALPYIMRRLPISSSTLVTGVAICLYAAFWYLDTSKDSTLVSFGWVMQR